MLVFRFLSSALLRGLLIKQSIRNKGTRTKGLLRNLVFEVLSHERVGVRVLENKGPRQGLP